MQVLREEYDLSNGEIRDAQRWWERGADAGSRIDQMGPSRLLFIDESLSKRLAALLKHRGRAAQSSSEAELLEYKDEPLLREIYKGGEDIVFVTAMMTSPLSTPAS